jgi:cyclomaltodextrinase / maltogenic alpha-amylase / neopullulanase
VIEDLEPLDQSMVPPGKYRHYKGNDYEVMGLVHHSETLEVLVLYRALYGEGGLWVRPLQMFLETVDVGGKRVRRFAPLG